MAFGRTAVTTDLGRYVTIRCPSCNSPWFEIVYDDEADSHLTRCASCGVRLIVKRLRDLD
jgi:DNA-directed RNA polymerase subunit RPC12/RpoP